MERFGWGDHPAPLARAWDETVGADDLVAVVGDVSWAMRPDELGEDFAWLEARPGRKVLLQGNHDYWWPSSAAKLREIVAAFPSIVGFLHKGSALRAGAFVFAGVRGWNVPETPADAIGDDPELARLPSRPDLVERDGARLERSIAAARELEGPGTVRVAAMHFPPLYATLRATRFSPLIEAWRPAVCVYGHLHGDSIGAGFDGVHEGVRYRLVSCDAVAFRPILVVDPEAATEVQAANPETGADRIGSPGSAP